MSVIAELLNRPVAQRIQEFRYRCAQSLIFGLPVLGLEWLGPKLGGPEAERWISIFQSVLSGWIVYVAAAGMFFEGLVAPRRKVVLDFVVASLAITIYFQGVITMLPIVFASGPKFGQPMFYCIVPLLAIWSFLRFYWLSR